MSDYEDSKSSKDILKAKGIYFNSPKDMTECLETCLSIPKEKRKKTGAALRAKAEKDHSWASRDKKNKSAPATPAPQ